MRNATNHKIKNQLKNKFQILNFKFQIFYFKFHLPELSPVNARVSSISLL